MSGRFILNLMAVYIPIDLTYIIEGERIDFNLVAVPTDIIPALMNSLRYELSKRIERETQPSFKDERAKQHQRHLEHCQKTGTIPKQQFIDFPIS